MGYERITEESPTAAYQKTEEFEEKNPELYKIELNAEEHLYYAGTVAKYDFSYNMSASRMPF